MMDNELIDQIALNTATKIANLIFFYPDNQVTEKIQCLVIEAIKDYENKPYKQLVKDISSEHMQGKFKP